MRFRRDGTFFILAKVGTDGESDAVKVLVQDPLVGKPETWDADKLSREWDGRLILMTTRKRIMGDERRFDISWFIPAVVKYRKLFSEVLLASLFIQVFALDLAAVLYGDYRQGVGTSWLNIFRRADLRT